MVLPALLIHSLEWRRREPQAPWGGGIRRGSAQDGTPEVYPCDHKMWQPHRVLLPDPVFIQRTPL